MARLTRLALAGQVHFVMQRGHNGQAVVSDDLDRQTLVDELIEQAQRHQVAIHAYVLTDTGFQLLLTPQTAEGVPKMMQSVGRSYARFFNARHGRSGTLWEGRYRSTVIQPERHLLPCMVSMDTAPVREQAVDEPPRYRWSSHRHHVGLVNVRGITTHALYWGLGNTPFAREAAYAEMVRAGVTGQQIDAMDQAVSRGWVLGDPDFVDALQQQTGRRLRPNKAGRPRKTGARPSQQNAVAGEQRES